MKIANWPVKMALGLSLIQLFSCQKDLKKTEEVITFETSSEAVLYNEFSDCKLRTYEAGESKGTFVYHPDGLPDNLTYNNTGTGNPNYYFLYDNKRRLREFRIGYSKTSIVEAVWHKYGYNNLNQIVTDTLYNPGYTDNGGTFPDDIRRISQITYDAQNRIIKEIVQNADNGTSRTETYAYDSKGNLIVNGWASSSYDNNVSIFRTHPLFQFIHRNYSKNNAAPQAKYNAKGLPLSYNPGNDIFFNTYPAREGGSGVTKAMYDCDGFSPVNEFLYCKLRTIVNSGRIGTFVYHPDGLPDQLTYSSGGTGLYNYYFLYDNKRRLREFRVGYGKTDPVESMWHRYGYNNVDQIIVDTLYNPSQDMANDPSITIIPRVISTFTYDNQGRIKTEFQRWFSSNVEKFTLNYTYNYDSRGNLIVDGWPSSSYDNNVSIFRAHTVFQFIHRNYSRNNAAVQAKYNSKGLPLSNNPMNNNFFNGDGAASITKATYDCQ
jgi:hypothetical protein